MTRILYWYALSGFISLGYQVAWFRIVTDWHGSTNFTFALVVSNFIGGLATGSLLSRRTTAALSKRLASADGLRIYGAVEMLVAASILLTALVGVLPADLFGSFPYHESAGIYEHDLAYQLFQVALAATCVFIPCFFMGVSFPLLCDTFRDRLGGARFPSRLYAWNTLGACLGVLACQFVLLPTIGHGATIWAMAATNALLGLYFVSGAAGRSSLREEEKGRNGDPVVPTADSPASTATYAHLLLLASVAGFLSGGLEGDLFKRITFVIELNPGATMTLISFWAIVAIFLASVTVERWPGLRLAHIKLSILLGALYAIGAWQFVDAIRSFVELSVFPAPVEAARTLEGFRNLQFPSGLGQLFVFVGILVFPPYFAISLLLPHTCNALQSQGRHLGVAYGLNTLAFCIGLLAFVLLAPMVNIFFSLKLFLVFFAIGAGWLWILRESLPLAAWKPALLIAGFAVATLSVPSDFDPSFFPAGSPPATYPVRAVKSNGANTTFVLDVPGSPRLYFGRLQMSATNLRARTYMRLMAHYPLLLNPAPRKALLICFGVGNTAAGIASHESIEAIDVVDLDEKVFETAPEFATVNEEVYRDKRLRFIHDDGRSFLQRTERRYDVITSEPPPPLAAGVYRLYSREYYEEVLAHLTPRGYMSQWLPVFLMSPESVEMVISTFVSVFPHAFLFAGYGTDFILVGGREPIDPAVIDARFAASPRVATDLTRLNIKSPTDLLARIVQGDSELRAHYAGAPTISDLRNDLEHTFLNPIERPIVRLNPNEVIRYLEDASGHARPELAGILRHLGRLRYHVQGYPFETLATVDPATSPEVALADVDWLGLGALSIQNQVALQRGDSRRSERILEEFISTSREQPEVLLLLARTKIGQGFYDEAIALLDEFLALEPSEASGHSLRALAFARDGRAAQALESYRAAARLDPRSHQAVERMAWIHATHPDPALRDSDRALFLIDQARGIAGRDLPEIRETRAASLAAAGRFDEAEEIVADLLASTSPNHKLDLRRYKRQLGAYRKREALSEPKMRLRPVKPRGSG